VPRVDLVRCRAPCPVRVGDRSGATRASGANGVLLLPCRACKGSRCCSGRQGRSRKRMGWYGKLIRHDPGLYHRSAAGSAPPRRFLIGTSSTRDAAHAFGHAASAIELSSARSSARRSRPWVTSLRPMAAHVKREIDAARQADSAASRSTSAGAHGDRALHGGQALRHSRSTTIRTCVISRADDRPVPDVRADSARAALQRRRYRPAPRAVLVRISEMLRVYAARVRIARGDAAHAERRPGNAGTRTPRADDGRGSASTDRHRGCVLRCSAFRASAGDAEVTKGLTAVDQQNHPDKLVAKRFPNDWSPPRTADATDPRSVRDHPRSSL
jgi:hypothetical protein